MENLDFLNNCKSLNDISRKLYGKVNYLNREKVKKYLLENGINWKEWLETIKKNKTKYCIVCGKKLEKHQKLFCSHSCSAKHNNKARKDISYCKNCNKELIGRQKNFCSHECQQEYEYKEYIQSWKIGKENGMKGNCSISNYVKRYLLEKTNCSCEICGCNWVNPKSGKPIVEIHHIDGNAFNNKEENLQVLCPNHHAMTENYKNNNKNNGRKTHKNNN